MSVSSDYDGIILGSEVLQLLLGELAGVLYVDLDDFVSDVLLQKLLRFANVVSQIAQIVSDLGSVRSYVYFVVILHEIVS